MVGMVRMLLVGLLAAFLIAAPSLYYRAQEARYRNLRVVTPGVLYRSGQLTPGGLRQVLHDYGIRTVVSLRENDSDRTGALKWEETYCLDNDVAYVRVPPGRWWSEDGPPPVLEHVEIFLGAMRNPEKYPRPVLLHCFAGQHRTGAFAAIYRMEFERWPPRRAIEEMRRCGYANIDHEWDVRALILMYQPSWKRASQASGYRLQATGYRLQATGFRLQASER